MNRPMSKSGLNPTYPRFSRTDRFPTSCSILSALSQLEQLGVRPGDIRLILEDRRRYPQTRILSQEPPPGMPLRHGTEVRLRLAADGVVSRLPEGLFVSQPGEEGRLQLEQARRLFAPFDKAGLLALSRLRFWNVVFSGGNQHADLETFIFRVLGLDPASLERGRRIFSTAEIQAWTRILPQLDRVVGDQDKMQAVLRRFMRDPVELRPGSPMSQDVPPDHRLKLVSGSPNDRADGPGDLAEDTVPHLGQMFLGDRISVQGRTMVLKIGPLSPERIELYAGPTFRSRVDRPSGAVIVDLGPVCELDRFWKAWESGEGFGVASGFASPGAGHEGNLGGLLKSPDPFTTQWPRLVYLLQYLMPAHLMVRVHLLPETGPGWVLGTGDTADGHFASILGAWTALTNPVEQ